MNIGFNLNYFTGSVLYNEPLKNHLTIGVGGPARVLLLPKCTQDITKTIVLCNENSIPCTVIGNGTNVIAPSDGFDGVVIKIANEISEYSFLDEKRIHVEAGMSLPKLIKVLLKNDCTGYSFLTGIPGTIGGCTAMNAGTVYGCIASLLSMVEYYDGKSITQINGSQIDEYFSYRSSLFLKNKYVVTSVILELQKGDIEEEKQKNQKYLQKRKFSQPLYTKNAGCFWKNTNNQSTGALIEQLGLKGKKNGDAKISERHGNFIVNTRNATFEEIIQLAESVEAEVFNQTGIILEREIQLISINDKSI
ncbi:MAG: UDP-N-acetylmuramate dehydrogenase [Caldisericia bacterium]|nr:UDP-N-acetylmuramate dehydrogenase [Caldisericia bacterium]